MNSIPKVGLWVAALVVTFIFSALIALIRYSPDLNLTLILSDPYYWHVTRFSFYQALMSTLLSVFPAVALALALYRRHFIGKSLLIKLFSSTLVLPVLVGVFGLIAIYGRSGWLSQALSLLGIERTFSLYGLNGILLAHVFFNLPYAARLFLHSLDSIPDEQNKLALHLGMTPWQRFRFVEWPRLRQQLPHVFGLVFMLCFTSFATVMALGGGPKATTIELAIYQAIKFDFDLQSGALLALWQMLLCAGLALLIQGLAKPIHQEAQTSILSHSLFRDTRLARGWDAIIIALSLVVVLPPLIAVVVSGLNSKLLDVLLIGNLWFALANSLRVACSASLLALACGVAILTTSRAWRLRQAHRKADMLELSGTMILVTPGLVVSTGLFLLLRNTTDVFNLAYWIVVWVNALMGLPYVIKTLHQPMWLLAKQYQQLCVSLGLTGWQRWSIVEWRAMKKPFAHAFVISFLVAMGDLSAIALFGSQDFQTLPLYLYRLLGSYQMEAAAVVSLLMLAICIGCFYLADKLFHITKEK